VVVNVFLISTSVVLNHFAEGSQIQTYNFFREPHKKFHHKSIDTFVLLHWRSWLHKILEVLLKDAVYRKEPFPSKELDTKLL